MDGAGGVGGLTIESFIGEATTNAFVTYDGNGNVTALVDASTSAIQGHYEYSPFGTLIRATGLLAGQAPFRFSTKVCDSESGLVYYGRRHFSTMLARWISRDPSEEQAGNNLYCFVRNAPLGAFDPIGLSDLFEDYQYSEAKQLIDDEIVDYAMQQEGFSESERNRLERTLAVIPNDGFVMAGVEGKKGGIKGEVLALAGGEGLYGQAYAGIVSASGKGKGPVTVMGGMEWTTSGSDGILFFDVDFGIVGGGKYVSPHGRGFYIYVGTKKWFIGFGLGRAAGS